MAYLIQNYEVSNGDSEWVEKVPVTDGSTSFQVIASGFNASDSVVKVQFSNDNSNFQDVPSLIQTLPSGDNTINFTITSITHRYYKVVFTANSVTFGTLSIAQP